jgi:hypothetical protein
MAGYYGLLLWVVSLLAATVVGYFRGRWELGLGLGLAFGPLGALAIGLIDPAVEVEARRRYLIGQQLELLRRDDQQRAVERRHQAEIVEQFARALEAQVAAGGPPALAFPDGLASLANELDELAQANPSKEPALRAWIDWLNDQARIVRESGAGRPANAR